MQELLFKIKEDNQDFEFYPTTREMVKVIYDDFKSINSRNSILDIGAGNGNIFNIMDDLIPEDENGYRECNIDKYAIEKSEILINAMDKDIMILGTDFYENTLIDKKMDIIFCNPPYKEYKKWMEKIISECNCKTLYFVVPERWNEQPEIIKSLQRRFCLDETGQEEEKYQILWTGDFLDSEYRKARAKVHIIKIDFSNLSNDYDSFNVWFDNNFAINADKNDYDTSSYKEEKSRKEQIHEIVKGKNIVEALEELYQEDFEKLLNTYKKLEELDASILKELNVNVSGLKESLKVKIEGLKNLYWKELFDNMDKITERLTSKSRESMLNKLMEHTHIDFTVSNAYALIIWVLKNANQYIDDQLLYIYFQMASKDNIINYKSNKVFQDDNWRYARGEITHYKLDYRLVFTRHYCFNQSDYGSYDYPKGLSKSAHDFLNDICTIGKNLGFKIIDSSFNYEWSPGQEKTFIMNVGAEVEPFMKIRAYKNGNIHCKLNQEFIMKLNIESARLNKWVKDETELAEELDISILDVKKHFKSNLQLVKSNIKLLPQGVDNENKNRC